MRSKRGIPPALWAAGGSLIAFACSLTVPSKEELFQSKGSGGEDDGGTSGSNPSGGTMSSEGGRGGQGGRPLVEGGSAGESGENAGGSGERAGAAGTAGDTAAGAGGTSNVGEGGSGGGSAGGTGLGSGGTGGEGGSIDYGPFEPGKGLIGHYAFDETDGAVAHDEIADLDATVNGTVTWVTGKIGGALRLSGGSAYVDVPVSPLATLEEVTFAIWFNPGTQTLWTRVLDVGSSQAHWMYFSPAAAPPSQSTGTHAALDVANQITAELHVASFVPPIQTWTHVAITWSRKNFAYYINGELAANDDTPLFTPAEFATYTPATETLRAWIGRSSFSVDAYFTGAVDDFRIYDHALPPPHVAALHELEE